MGDVRRTCWKNIHGTEDSDFVAALASAAPAAAAAAAEAAAAHLAWVSAACEVVAAFAMVASGVAIAAAACAEPPSAPQAVRPGQYESACDDASSAAS